MADAESYLAKQMRFDPDLWIVEVEDRQGWNFLGRVVKIVQERKVLNWLTSWPV